MSNTELLLRFQHTLIFSKLLEKYSISDSRGNMDKVKCVQLLDLTEEIVDNINENVTLAYKND